MQPDPYDVAILGSGFAGTLLARSLNAVGQRVLLLEKGSHPRFALGESSTPLANLSLERLAERYGLDDLYALASHGRWCRRYPEIGRGLKRGFVFYRHELDRPDPPSERSERLLVAASPGDETADTQWLRSDLDAFWVSRAQEEGVDYRDQFEVEAVDACDEGAVIFGSAGERELRDEALFVVDATGAGGCLRTLLGLEAAPSPSFLTRLVYGHFSGLPPFGEAVGLDPSRDPFSEQWAAVHHLFDCGWMYQLRFDDGTTSVGFVVEEEKAKADGVAVDWRHPAEAFQLLLSRLPALERQFATAKPLFPLCTSGILPYRLTRATGDRWALLPHAFAFFDPLFSTGNAWSLLGVERLAQLLRHGPPEPDQLAAYDSLLNAEADQIQRLIEAGYEILDDFDAFSTLSQLYFVTVSFSEAAQRLLDYEEWERLVAASRSRIPVLEDWCWEGFLGARDTRLLEAFRESRGRAAEPGSLSPDWIREIVAPFNLAGLLRDEVHPLYPVDLDLLTERSALLGLTADEMRRRLPRLREAAPVRLVVGDS